MKMKWEIFKIHDTIMVAFQVGEMQDFIEGIGEAKDGIEYYETTQALRYAYGRELELSDRGGACGLRLWRYH